MKIGSVILLIVLTLILQRMVPAQDKNVVGFFNAGFEQSEFLLKWEIANPEGVSKFVVSKKKSSNAEFARVCEVPLANFRKSPKLIHLLFTVTFAMTHLKRTVFTTILYP